jgi:hypothetical protein
MHLTSLFSCPLLLLLLLLPLLILPYSARNHRCIECGENAWSEWLLPASHRNEPSSTASEPNLVLIQLAKSATGVLSETLRTLFECKSFSQLLSSGRANGVLSSLADQLNSELCHFLLELVQNSDDIRYNPGTLPLLKFRLHGNGLLVISNEIGFTQRDVESICSVGDSTKVGIADTTGEKGIGFKSLFKAVDEVTISSNGYHFQFSANRPCGRVVPEWKELPPEYQKPNYKDKTVFLLTFSNAKKLATVKEELRKFDAKLLLFLRRLRIIEIDIEGRITRIERKDHGPVGQRVSQLISHGDSIVDSQYAMVSIKSPVTVVDAARPGFKDTTVTLAFPLSTETEYCHAYNCLPICPTGFPFLLQADFILSASREGLNESHAEWNQMLFSALADAYLVAVKRFAADLKLRFTWVKYLPIDPPSSHLRPVSSLIQSRIKDQGVLLTQSGTTCFASRGFYHVKEWRDDNNLPLLDHASLTPPSISTKYSGLDSKKLQWLGGKLPAHNDMLRRVRSFLSIDHGAFFQSQPVSRQALLAKALLQPRFTATELGDLPLVKVSNGRWIAATGQRIFFPQNESADIPTLDMPPGLPEVEVVATDFLSCSSNVRTLYQKLGVKQGTVREVCAMIKKAHGEGTPPSTNRDALIQHATYLFKAEGLEQYSSHFSPFMSLWMCTEGGKTARSQDMYQPRHRIQASARECLNDVEALYMDAKYFVSVPIEQHDKFSDWLTSTCKALTSLRVCKFNAQGKAGNEQSKEFKAMMNKKKTGLFLEVVASSWEQNFGQDSYNVPSSVKSLGTTSAPWAENRATSVLLSDTFLPSKAIRSLAPSSVPFLKALDPDAPQWQVLRHLGVMTEGRISNVDFWLACLRSLLNTVPEKSIVVDLYKRLSLLHDYNSNSIR